jgi:anti-sigma B factor antagonist
MLSPGKSAPLTDRERVSDPNFPVAVRDGLAIVTTPDEIDIGNAGMLREALLAAGAARVPIVIVDMSGTEFCDSTGLSVLVRALRQSAEDGGELRLVVGGSALRRILAVTGVAGMFRVYDSLGQALEAA